MRIEWTEVRRGETFRIDAQKTSLGWAFQDKSIWEARWYAVKNPSPELIAKAEKLSRKLKIVKSLQFKRPKVA